MTGSSLFWNFKNIWISKKTKRCTGIRTRSVFVEAHKDLHYAIESSVSSQFNKNINFLSPTKTVIYFTIYDKLIKSRKLKVWYYNFLINLDRKNIKLTSSGTWPAQIDEILKRTLAPPGGHGEVVKVGHIVWQTIGNELPIFVSGQITLRSAFSWDP